MLPCLVTTRKKESISSLDYSTVLQVFVQLENNNGSLVTSMWLISWLGSTCRNWKVNWMGSSIAKQRPRGNSRTGTRHHRADPFGTPGNHALCMCGWALSFSSVVLPAWNGLWDPAVLLEPLIILSSWHRVPSQGSCVISDLGLSLFRACLEQSVNRQVQLEVKAIYTMLIFSHIAFSVLSERCLPVRGWVRTTCK
jgi:hypothetical protein